MSAEDQVDDMPEMEVASDNGEDVKQVGSKQNRAEKKARKAMQKLGLKAIPGITRVTVVKNKTVLFVIGSPDVLKNPSSDTYVIFGEAKIDDGSGRGAGAAQNPFGAAGAVPTPAAAPASADLPAVEEAADGEEDSGEGIEDKDIDLVMSQADVSRQVAIKALRRNDNDIVNAIMEITM
jgi:nascent polypeptide-associated complex subunit alpha